ncbi:DUF3168 domain-containing protein [Listeria sp. ILCC792]|uniref:DUF3168 domain-containing protein n=1 Tax=Listeria sp. ILCC792 TaxID=1918331 RepID=UPI000B58764A|nr:DUF3168 domain-containing protein [Listeria sp. ILCC792]
MVDILDVIYQRFVQNSTIQAHCEDRIYYYTYPETADKSKPFLIISPLEPPIEDIFGSDSGTVERVSIQIDVESQNRLTAKEIQLAVKEELKRLNITQDLGGLDDYFPETTRYVDSRRYSGLPFSLYEEEFK